MNDDLQYWEHGLTKKEKRNITFCDNCVEPFLLGMKKYFIDKLPCDIDSENKGGSATLCKKCYDMVLKND